jgi:hypothetical protein
MHTPAFLKRCLSAGVVQQTDCRPERREIVTRTNGLDEVPELLPQRLIGVSTVTSAVPLHRVISRGRRSTMPLHPTRTPW